MATSEINYNSGTIVDLENDSITPEVLLEGETAHDATGASIRGTMRTVPNSAMLGDKGPEYYLSPKDYLDNGYFLNPANQRGSTELTQSGTYPVDRWVFLHSSGTTGKATVSAAGITITKSDEAEYCDLYQKIANPEQLVGKPITFAVKFAGYDTPLVLNAPFGNGNYNAHYGDGEIRIFTYDNSKAYIRLRNVGTSMTVEWAALYEGTYLPENLPPYVPKGYAAELAECQRYYQYYSRMIIAPKESSTGAAARMYFQLQPPMRITPTVTTKLVTGAAPASVVAKNNQTVDIQASNEGHSDFSLALSADL